ncbi:MAG: ribosome biogenesis GTPase Der [Nitrospina sp.]|jgi:GTPase|nr:ribosome biogenesis GTPase Der [Nitrospina sp.]MBT3508104.1 ribosome biogenesis GTPase Der [Nitrospina sp.]MBT3876314.1 ribosome biogenesis GTPase Der [Nitrospina sp.]MBT4049970.1 ribosome biogenesis GTPase Der [Nitrospina sp.]MBT4556630.1 ribosome biogenesis GTPase Der [Nitrospina sp.]
MTTPIVAIVGRANVGKSTLFNKLTQSRSAIVNDTPGVTRDRMYGAAELGIRPVLIIDTGGVDVDTTNKIELQVVEQAQWARQEADSIIVVVDNQTGLTGPDREMISQVRKSGKPFFLAVNKVDSPSHHFILPEFSELGLENTFPVSAEHGNGLYELIEAVSKALPDIEPESNSNEGSIRIAVIGRPNVGKSSLINNLLKSERCIVSDIPGTTRDAIDTFLESNGREFVLVDTAGIRRKGKTSKVLDKFSVIMALKALDRCDVAVLVLDSTQPVSDQDATVAGYALDRGKGCLILGNKWDLSRENEISFEEFEDRVRYRLKFLEFAPIVTVSAKTGMRISNILPQVEKVYEEYSRSIPTAHLNACFERAIQKNPMSSYRGKFMKLFYATQVKKGPPTFKCFLNFPEGIHFSYRRYLINSLRKKFGFTGTPVRLILSGKRKGIDS